MDLDLTELTEEELFLLRDQVNNRIDEIRKEERNEEAQRLREKYEGKCFVTPEGGILRIDRVIDKYWARVWLYNIEESDDDFTMTITNKDVNGVFQPRLNMNGKIIENSFVSKCDEITWEDAKKHIYKLFNRVRKEFLGLDDSTRQN